MKRSTIIPVLLSSLIALLIIEAGYRVLLSRRVVAQAEAMTKPDPDPTFSFYAYPAPWRFDKEQGFVFNEKPWLSGSINKGSFNGCKVGGGGNKFGNAYTLNSDYEHARVKAFLLGSSYTMVANKEGKTISDLLEARLSKSLGTPVSILNFSRDATGILTSFDIARAKISELHPDFLLFMFNTSALDYQRHWRVVHRDPYFDDMWRMSFSLDPDDMLADRRRVVLQPHVISNEVTQAWCDRMTTAMNAQDKVVLQNDPLVKKLIAMNQKLRIDLETPPFAVDFFSPEVSFVYNKLIHRNPYRGMKVYAEKTIQAPLAIEDFAQDAKFVDTVEFLKTSGVPFLLIHIPTLPEMEGSDEGEFTFGISGVQGAQEQSRAVSLERITGRPIAHLYRYYNKAVKRTPRDLVYSQQDWHPTSKGVEVMSEAVEAFLLKQPWFPPKSSLSRVTAGHAGPKRH